METPDPKMNGEKASGPTPQPTAPDQAAADKPASTPPAATTVKPAAPATPPAPAAPPAPPPPVPAALAHLKLPLQGVHFNLRGIDAEAKIGREQVLDAARELDLAGFALDTITGVDWMAESQMEVIYDYFHPEKPLRVTVRARIPREKPEIPTICPVFPGANWHERETHDFFGIIFTGHPNLEPFLLPEDANYHPLRKDFTSCS